MASEDGQVLADVPEYIYKANEMQAAAVRFCIANPAALRYAPVFVRNDTEVLTEAVRRGEWNNRFLYWDLNKIKGHADLFDAVSQNMNFIEYKFQAWKHDYHFALISVRQNGELLGKLCKRFRKDADIVRTAVTQNGAALRFASETCRSDLGIVTAALRQNAAATKYIYGMNM